MVGTMAGMKDQMMAALRVQSTAVHLAGTTVEMMDALKVGMTVETMVQTLAELKVDWLAD